MNTSGILRIEKRPLPYWLILWIVALPLCWGTFFHLLSLPSILKYTADIAWIGLLVFMIFRRTIEIQKKILPIVALVAVFFTYCLVMYLINYQSVIYFLWGVRNNFRFYIFFFAIAVYLQERDAERVFEVLDFLFWINIPITIIQYFIFDYKQDFLGGIFGVESGANASTIIFFTIILSRSVLKYMEKDESFSSCAAKCISALFIAALAELKFFFVFFLVILVMAAFLTEFSWRKVVIFAVGAAIVSVASALLVALFGFESFLSIDKIWEVATQEHYSSDQTVNRLSAIPTLTETVVPDFSDRVFGMGLGNCDTSSFEICNTAFYQNYGHLRYTFFSVAFLFLEVGYIGILLYISFFALCFLLIRKRLKQGMCNELHGRVALIMAVLAFLLVFYNASLRAEQGYLAFLTLALPFVGRETLTA